MPLTVGGRRVGGKGPSTPLDPTEGRLADRVGRVLRELASGFDVQAYVNAIASLDPDLLERLLTDVTTGRLSLVLEDTFADVFRQAAEKEYDKQSRSWRRSGASQVVRTPGGVLGAPVMVGGGEFSYLPRVDVLSHVDERAKMWAATRSAELVREIDDSNRLAIRRVISQAFTGPMTPQQTAVALESVVGLHSRWADAVLRFKDASYQSLLREGVPSGRASEMAVQRAAQYRKMLIRRRAQMIARTEIQQAQNWARQAAWTAGSESGVVDPASEKQWTTAPPGSRYGPPCPICMELRGKRVPWNGVFPNGQTMPPAHPHCRCTAVLVPPTRGLTGLPSQDLRPWLEQLQAMDTEPVLLSKGLDEDALKARERRFASRSEAARYAASIRWKDGAGKPKTPRKAASSPPEPPVGWNPASGDPMPRKITGEVDVSTLSGYPGVPNVNDWPSIAETFQDGSGVVLMRNVKIAGGSAEVRSAAAIQIEGGTWVMIDLTNSAVGPLGKGDDLGHAAYRLAEYATDVHAKQSILRDSLGDDAARRVNSGVAFTSRPNPADAYWSERYGQPITSVASAGDGKITVWGKDGFTQKVYNDTFFHESGHNVDRLISGKAGGIAKSPEYEKAVMDDYAFLSPGGDGYPAYSNLVQPASSHLIMVEYQDNPAGKESFPYGITTYGKSSPAEEFAESFRLFIRPAELGYDVNTDVSITFQDLFPNRHRLISDYVESVASGKVKR